MPYLEYMYSVDAEGMWLPLYARKIHKYYKTPVFNTT